MATETLEELRERLLNQESVRQMIQMRAYEIYQMRGCKPGGEAQDWFHAEGEVLAFLLADGSTRNDEQPDHVSAAPTSSEIAAASKPKSRAGAKSGAVKASAKKKPATKRASSKKSAESKSPSARTSKKSTPEQS